MSDLLGTRPADTFGFILQCPGSVGSGLVVIQDGRGRATALSLSNAAAKVTGPLAVTGALTAASLSGDGTLVSNLQSSNLVGAVPIAGGGTGGITASGARTSLGVPPSTRLVATSGNLTGGGDLSADRLLALVDSPTVSSLTVLNDLVASRLVSDVWQTSLGGVAVAGAKVSAPMPWVFGGNVSVAKTMTASGVAGDGSALTNLSAANISGIIQVGHGGTGAASTASGLANLGGVPLTRTISTGQNLTGGGDLTANRTLSLVNTPTVSGMVSSGTITTSGLTVTGPATVGTTITASGYVGDGSRLYAVRDRYSLLDTSYVPASGHTKLQLETFQGVGSLASGTPGGLGVVANTSGVWRKRPAGPMFSGSGPYGWSAAMSFYGNVPDSTLLNDSYWSFASNPTAELHGLTFGWVKFLGAGGGAANYRPMLRLETSNGGITMQWMVKANPTDATVIDLKFDPVYVAPATLSVPLNTWVYLGIGWTQSYPGGPLSLRGYVMVLGKDTYPQVVGEVKNATQSSTPTGVRWVRWRAYGSTDWWGRLGAVGLYQIDSINAADLHPGEFRAPVERPTEWYVDPVAGNDNNPGVRGYPWQTWDKLVDEVTNAGVLGSAKPWQDQQGRDASLATIPTVEKKTAWLDAYDRGERVPGGDVILFDTTSTYCQVTQPLVLSATSGVHITSATSARADLRVNKTLNETWTQPNSGSYPHVWRTAGTGYAYSVPYEWTGGGWVQSSGIGASTTGVAIPLLEAATSGAFYADAGTGKLYYKAVASGNPNTDGVPRQYSPVFGITGLALIDITGGKASRLAVDGGMVYDPTNGQVYSQYCIANTEWNGITVIDDCLGSRSGKHTFANVGNLTMGLVYTKNCVATLGPAAVFQGFWSHFVDYTASMSAGSIVSCYDGCQTVLGASNVGAPGGTDANYEAFISHGGVSDNFALRIIRRSNFGAGLVSAGDPTTTLCRVQDTTAAFFSASVETLIAERCLFTARMPDLECTVLAKLTDCIMVGNNTYSQGPSNISGTVQFDRCTFDLTYDFQSSSWERAGATTVSITNSVLLTQNNTSYGIINDVAGSDVITISNSVIQGTTGYILFHSFNGGGNKTFSDGIASGILPNTVFTTNAQLDAANNYAVASGTSPVIGSGVPTSVAPDFTGSLFATRDDVGAREYKTSVLAGQKADLVPVGRKINVTGVLTGGGTLDKDITVGLAASAVLPSQSGNGGKFLTTDGSTASWATSSGAGTVTSAALALPTGVFSVSGSPVTNSGTLTGSLVSQAGNKVFASPDGASGVPTIRSVVLNDLPNTVAVLGSGNAFTVANQSITSDNGGHVTLTIKDGSGQSVPILEIIRSDNLNLVHVKRSSAAGGQISIYDSGGGETKFTAEGGFNVDTGQTATLRFLPSGNDVYYQNTVSTGNIVFSAAGGATSTGFAVFKTSRAGFNEAVPGGTVQITSYDATLPNLTVKGGAGQTGDQTKWQDSGNTVGLRVNKMNYLVIAKNSGIPDADLSANECALWFDSTNGAARLIAKAKQANGTVVSGILTLS